MLHCVSIYPTPLEDANLSRINYLKSICKSVGLSDHSNPETTEHILSVMAFTMNIDYLERHFTILKKNETKDGPVSINPEQLKELSDFSKLSKKDQKKLVEIEFPKWKKTIGLEKRELSDEEMDFS